MQILSRCFIIICVRGCSLSRLERFAHIEEVGGSSPSIPTISPRALYRPRRFFAKAACALGPPPQTATPLPWAAAWLWVRACPPAYFFGNKRPTAILMQRASGSGSFFSQWPGGAPCRNRAYGGEVCGWIQLAGKEIADHSAYHRFTIHFFPVKKIYGKIETERGWRNMVHTVTIIFHGIVLREAVPSIPACPSAHWEERSPHETLSACG